MKFSGFYWTKINGVKKYNFDGNTEGFPVGTYDSGSLVWLDSKCFAVADSSKVGE